VKINPLQAYTLIAVKRPLLWLLSFVLLICILLFLIKFSFEYGRGSAGYDSASADAYIGQLQAQLEKSQAKIIESERRTTMLKHNSRIDDDASVQVEQSLVAVQDEVLELKKELAFYKSIVAPEQSGRSITIQTVQLKKNEADGYQYKIMVSQQGRNDKLVRGTINIRIKGTSKGESVTYSLSDVSKDVKEPMKFGFKYFQNFEGLLKLPVAFTPDSLHITANPKTGKIKAIDEQYGWSDLTTGGV
jgi:hypothetical protein